jgi:hypothetical protein
MVTASASFLLSRGAGDKKEAIIVRLTYAWGFFFVSTHQGSTVNSSGATGDRPRARLPDVHDVDKPPTLPALTNSIRATNRHQILSLYFSFLLVAKIGNQMMYSKSGFTTNSTPILPPIENKCRWLSTNFVSVGDFVLPTLISDQRE